jgi:hypothetical protein
MVNAVGQSEKSRDYVDYETSYACWTGKHVKIVRIMEIQPHDDKDCEIASWREAPAASITTASSDKEEVEN